VPPAQRSEAHNILLWGSGGWHGIFHHSGSPHQSHCCICGPENSALITVEQGEVSADLLISELARILPVQWEWSAQPHGPKSYVVPFPSKAELDRMVAIRAFTTRNRGGTLIFKEFDADVQPIKVLDQVWVTVTNVPKALRAYLPLWAVGSCIGNTQKVDMVYFSADWGDPYPGGCF
jgi:hypothetical protein